MMQTDFEIVNSICQEHTDLKTLWGVEKVVIVDIPNHAEVLRRSGIVLARLSVALDANSSAVLYCSNNCSASNQRHMQTKIEPVTLP